MIGLLAVVSAFGALDDDRITGLTEQVKTLETVVAATKDASEKARLNEKLDRLHEELRILHERQDLDTRERALKISRGSNTFDQLREKLRSVDVSPDEPTARLTELAAERRLAARERDQLETQLAAMRGQLGVAADRQVDLEERLATKNEELRAIALEREAAEELAQLAQDTAQLKERMHAADLSADQPSLRILFESYTRARTERKVGGQLNAAATDILQKLQVSQDALALSRQKLAKFDEELALLEKQTGFFRRDERVDRLLAQQRNQKATLGARLPVLERQVEAIKSMQHSVLLRQELTTLKASFEEENFARLKATYVRRLRWPSVALGTLIALQLVASYLLLPLAFRDESLFMARRLTRYLVVLLVVAVFAGFLFDDLSTIVATLGIVSAALVISLQDVCTSVAGWCAIMAGGKFGIGDRLEIDGSRGDVIDIQLLRTTLIEINGWLGTDQPTGRVIVLPNNFIFKNKVFNFTYGHPYIWGKIDLTITFSTPVASAIALFERVLTEETKEQFEEARRAASSMQKRYGVADADYRPKVLTHIADSGVTLSLFYVAHFRKNSETRNRINRRLIAELESRRHIQLAFNTIQVIHQPTDANGPAAMLGADETSPPFVRRVGSVPPIAPN
ncbi:MAG: mechanosensitive ion channel domain-containing protein [Opitutus sp.]